MMKIDETIPKIDVLIEENNIFDGAKEILEKIRPNWPVEKIKYKLLTDGITNKLIGCNVEGENEEETVLVRIYGNKTDLLIDRKAETRNILLLNKLSLAPQLYATFHNGLAYQFVPGTTLSSKTVIKPEIYKLVARRMARMHKVKNGINQKNCTPSLWNKMQRFLDLVPHDFTDPRKQKRFLELNLPKKGDLQKEKEFLKHHLSQNESLVVFAHNDLLLGNVIYTEKSNNVTFIDFEYAGFNYQAYDIGNHFAEFAGVDDVDYSYYPNKQLQCDWLKTYLEEFSDKIVTECDIEELYVMVNKYALAAHLFWGIWCLIQAEHSYIDFDFLKYAQQRLGEYFTKKPEYLALGLQEHPNKL
ncbi:ethanolamine kinase-like [Onthophagus taurus]|uniref:ethanolamine kinase-like n=1 Tax=Onthophagus taurus TaxID=166361 RepID=UPI0039BE1487